jgi:hypothetical protein
VLVQAVGDLLRIKFWYSRWGTWCRLSVGIPVEGRKIFSLFWGKSLWAHCMLIVEDQLSKVVVDLRVFWLRFLWFSWVSVIAYIVSGSSSSYYYSHSYSPPPPPSSSSGNKSVVDLSLFYFFRSFSTKHIFYGVGLSARYPTPNREGRSFPFSQVITFDMYGKGGPTSSYATASVAFKIIWPHQPHHYVTIGLPLGGGGSSA